MKKLRQKWRTLHAGERLVSLCAVIFIVGQILFIASGKSWNLEDWLSLSYKGFWIMPWQLITYSIVYMKIDNVVLDLLLLYGVARYFIVFLHGRLLLNLFWFASLWGGVTYLICTRYLYSEPMLQPSIGGVMVGIFALVCFLITYMPELKIFFFFTQIRLIYIVVVFLCLNFIQLQATGNIENIINLSGALCGFLYARLIRKGIDMGAWIGSFFDFFSNKF